MKMLQIIIFFFIYVFLYFFQFFCIFCIYNTYRLNLILFLSITQLVRCPSLGRDLFSGDHVPVTGWVTPQIFINTVTVDVRCSHPAANITDISTWAGFHLQFYLHLQSLEGALFEFIQSVHYFKC